ncbi:2-keto-4-pentenoate hydratase [Aliihoeflea sp. PC F10.4]
MIDKATAAKTILDAADGGGQMAPITDEDGAFALNDAYGVADAVLRTRIARGENVVGWKIGFTNRNIWDEYGVHAPIWGAMYDTTVREVHGPTECVLSGLIEPRIEPEIVLRLARRPEPGMDEKALMACVDAVGHGFEIVQSIYPQWRFRAADTVAAFALHGRYVHGPLVAVDDAGEWLRRLGDFRVTLLRDGEEIDEGEARDVLGGPLSALRHMIDGMAATPLSRGVEPGDLVTTGTVTRAFPVGPGERWSTRLSGLPFAEMDVTFAG